jgi:hypothetical protein
VKVQSIGKACENNFANGLLHYSFGPAFGPFFWSILLVQLSCSTSCRTWLTMKDDHDNASTSQIRLNLEQKRKNFNFPACHY